MATRAHTSLFVDGPNVDGVLGTILGHPPNSHQRPRWDTVKTSLSPKTKPNFVLNKLHFGDKVYPLYRALRAMGWQIDVVKKVGVFPDNDDPVDTFILERLHAALQAQRRGEFQQVIVVSHDHCYAPVLAEILNEGGSVELVGFREELAPDLLALEGLGAEVLDLEHDVGAFSCRLPRPCLGLYSAE